MMTTCVMSVKDGGAEDDLAPSAAPFVRFCEVVSINPAKLIRFAL
jgi:hypothetical protein